jgi:hypothetical protein
MAKQNKMIALRPFPFRGETLQVNEEFEPDDEKQANLLRTIGHAKDKPRGSRAQPQRSYATRVVQPETSAVMTASPEA